MTRLEKIASLYTAVIGSTPTAEQLNAYAGLDENISLEVISAQIMSDSPLSAGYDAMTPELLVQSMFQTVFDLTTEEITALKETEAGAAGFQYWVDEINDNPYVTADTIAIALINGAGEDSQAQLAADVADIVAAYDAAYPDGGTPVEEEGDTYSLKVSSDDLDGTADQDTFYAYVKANDEGSLANSLSTGDMINGGDSTDKLIGSLTNDEYVDSTSDDFAPMPILNSVEEIRLAALENGNVGGNVILDADQITGENHYASDSSRADFTITNVDILDTQITKDITLEMKDTQQNSDLAVYFDQDALVAAPDVTDTTAQYLLKVGDGESDPATPLENIKIDITINHNGINEVLEDIISTDGTYQGLVDAINTALNTAGLSSDYSAELSTAFSTIQTTNEIVDVNDGFDVLLTSLKDVPFLKTDLSFSIGTINSNVANLLASNADVYTVDRSTSNFVEASIIVDNVGRSSNGGEIVVGSTSNSNSSTGVEIINVEVRESSVIHDISTTNDNNSSWDGFQKLTLTNGTDYDGDFVLTNAVYMGDANLYGNVDNVTFKQGLEEIEATNFDGDIVLGRDNAIVDLGTLDANVAGDVTLNAYNIDGALHTVTTGSGDDTINMTLLGSEAAINVGNGTNAVTMNGIGAATITGGTGVDTIKGNSVTVEVDAKGGNDVVYTQNDGLKGSFVVDTSALDSATAAVADDQVDGNDASEDAAINSGVEFLYNAQVQVTLSFNGAAAVAFDEGFESELVTIETSKYNYLTTQEDVNNAIVKAINEDENNVLNKLAVASIEGGNVVVNYLVDGVQNAASVDVQFFAPESAWSPSIETAIENEFKDVYNDSDMVLDASAEQTNVLTALAAGLKSTANAVLGSATAYTIDFSTWALDTGDIVTIGTQTYTAAADGEDALTIAAGFTTSAEVDAAGVTNINGVAYTITNNLNGTVTITETGPFVGNNSDIDVFTLYDASTATTTTDALFTLTASPTVEGVATNNGLGTDSFAGANEVNGGSGDDVLVLTSAAAGDTVVYTGFNQGHDTIVHFDTTEDQLDVSAYLTNTASYSGSTESIVDVAGVTATDLDFVANSANLVDFSDLSGMAATVTFDNMTIGNIEAALEAADATTTEWVDDNGEAVLAQDVATSVLIIHDNDVANDGAYKMYQVTYDDATEVAGATDFSVTLIGSFDIQDGDHNSVLATGDLIVG